MSVSLCVVFLCVHVFVFTHACVNVIAGFMFIFFFLQISVCVCVFVNAD